MKNKIDEIDERIIYCLRKNGRITMKELGDMVHLSGQAAKNRVEKLEDIGVLQKYTINIDCPVFGFKIHALIRLQMEKSNLSNYEKKLKNDRCRMIHCYQVTGEQCYVFDMAFLEIEDLHCFLKDIEEVGRCEVNLVLKNMQDFED